MIGLLVSALVIALTGGHLCHDSANRWSTSGRYEGRLTLALGLALIAIALWLAYTAGGAA